MKRLLLASVSAVVLAILCSAAQFDVGERKMGGAGGLIVHDDFSGGTTSCGLDSRWINMTAYPIFVGNNCPYLPGYSSNGSNDSAAYWNADSFASYPNQYSQARISSLVTSGSSSAVGVIVRAHPPGFTAYLCEVYNNGSINQTYMQICNSGSCSIQTSGASVVVGDILRIEASGSVITCYKNGTSIMSFTDTSITSGQPGIYGGLGPGFGGSTIADTWTGGSLP